MATDLRVSQLIQRAPDGTEFLEVIIPPFTPGTNRRVLLSDLVALAGGAVTSVNSQTGVVVLDATGVGADPAGSASTVNTALSNHISDATDAHAATAITNTPAGNIAATTAQAAINELDTEKQAIANTASALTDGASIDITGAKHTLTTDEATITFSQSFTGDFTNIDVTFNTTAATWTFPAGSLCVIEGAASGNNTATVAAVSGDKIVISIWFVAASTYRVVVKNFGQ